MPAEEPIAAATTGVGVGADGRTPPPLRYVAPPSVGGVVDEPADLGVPEPSREFLELIPREYARRHLVLSVGCANGTEQLVVSGRTRPSAVLNVRTRLGRAVETRTGDDEAIAAAVDAAYDRGLRLPSAPAGGPDAAAIRIEGSDDVEHELKAMLRDADRDLLNLEGKSASIRLVDLILFEALQRDASDIHIQPLGDRTVVRYRLDGALRTVRELPLSVASAVVSRVKVMANLDVAERRAPQDGRATVTVGGSTPSGADAACVRPAASPGRRVDLRISTLPSTYGERVVLRVLDPSRSPHLQSFAGLGMSVELERRYLAQVRRTSGIVLSTGPTGSGKTTTLYATLSWVSAHNSGRLARGCELNILTVEDPVEYDLAGAGLAISQMQVEPKKNVTFASGLRHILRQDPDVIMVGEIRDRETAHTAAQASLTGHLVLSTLHTFDAASAVTRLVDLGVEPFLVSSSLAGVLAQRLVRTVHGSCDGSGCPLCLHTGFKGRTGLFELLEVTPELRERIGAGCSAVELKAAAEALGMITLHEAGARAVRTGVTTAEEVARVVDAREEDFA
jgi:general secretion pathway protein E